MPQIALGRVLSIGECMVEIAPSDTPDRYALGFAGDTFNTAWYLKALRPDLSVAYLSRVGRDEMSDAMLRMMREAGIETDDIGRDAQRSVGAYLISLRDGERSFSYWRDRAAARLLAEDPAALSAALARADVIYFSGITVAILEGDGREALLGAVADARSSGTRIIFDPNLRPRLWENADAMRDVVMASARVSDMALPSFDDEADWFGDADGTATLARYAEAGCQTVIVKDGAKPIHYQHADQRGIVALPAVAAVVDSTSAGDSFNAGLLAQLDSGADIETCLRNAAAVSRQVIGQRGALTQLDRGALAF
ncbi:sugar kinase [Gymnodinialimonas mytili]|uniref:sugar kinase n=1 Tax=Gymnodinialimonas mytili TaxID=3126503 RepID=UPI0030EB23C6